MPSTHPDIAFDDLLTALREAGFTLSPSDYVEFTAVFAAFSGSREDFKYYLAPILSRNREDQQKFYAIYERYITPPENRKQHNPEPAPHPYLTQKSVNWFMRRGLRLYYGCILLLSLAFTIARVVRLATRKKELAAITVIKPDSVITNSRGTASAPEQSPHKFIVKSQKPTREEPPEEKSTIIPIGQEIEKEDQVHSTAFAWLLMLGVASLFLSLSFFPLHRSRSRPHTDIDKLTGDPGPLDIPFQPKDRLIYDLPILAKIARDLAQPIPTDHCRLEIGATIRESIKAHGLLIPVYAHIERRPEWLLLSDKHNPLKAGLYRYLCRTLAKYSLPIYHYYHDGNDNYYAEGSTIPLNGYQLRQRHGDAHLIDPAAGEIPDPLAIAFDFYRRTGSTDIQKIRAYLDDEDLFQWLCAIAVYPTLRWEVVLCVGAAVLKARHASHKLNFSSLLQLTNIHWLSAPSGSIPDEVRLHLLKALGLPEELAARQAILDLLSESDEILLAGTATFEEKMLQVHTQSFILFAHDTRRNRAHESGARKFMSVWNRRRATDLATVLYLSNPGDHWSTPVRSAEDPHRAASADRFIKELLARKVIADPRIRSLFRTLSVTFFFLLLLLYLFKDTIQPTALNAGLGLIEHDYPITGTITANIPVTECLKKMTKGHYLLVTLKNYDNNLYSQLIDLDGKDTLKAGFPGVTMAGKDTSQPVFRLILNNALTIDCPAKQYYSSYTLLLRGEDCDNHLPEITPGSDRRPNPDAMQQ